MELTSRDRELVPAMQPASARLAAYFETARAVLLRGRGERGRRRARVSAAIGHALAFDTWRSLVREQGLEPEEAIGLMLATVDAAAGSA